MKKVALGLCLLFTMNVLSAQIPYAVSVHIGDSWANGIVGVEYQLANFGISAGYMPGRLFKENINSFSGALTLYGKDWNISCLYLTVAYASEGFIGFNYVDKTGSIIKECNVVPSIIILAGYKFQLYNKFNLKVGIGPSISKEGGRLEFEFVCAIPIFKHKIRNEYNIRYN